MNKTNELRKGGGSSTFFTKTDRVDVMKWKQ